MKLYLLHKFSAFFFSRARSHLIGREGKIEFIRKECEYACNNNNNMRKNDIKTKSCICCCSFFYTSALSFNMSYDINMMMCTRRLCGWMGVFNLSAREREEMNEFEAAGVFQAEKNNEKRFMDIKKVYLSFNVSFNKFILLARSLHLKKGFVQFESKS